MKDTLEFPSPQELEDRSNAIREEARITAREGRKLIEHAMRLHQEANRLHREALAAVSHEAWQGVAW